MSNQFHLNWDVFLENYWQKKPVLFRQAFKNFQDPLSAEELAGLAMESEINSKLVLFKNGNWNISNGPFVHFNELGEKDSALLVYGVNHWHENAASLIAPFMTLPQWQFDDLMISLSTPGGTVGPHIDQYGVFIIQGSGRRHWRVGEKQDNYAEFSPVPGLLHVESFVPVIDDELIAGDMLYIPPGCPHDGYSIEPSLSYSIGFRTPNAQDLLSGLLEYTVTHNLGLEHYQDPDLTLPTKSYQITPNEITGLKTTLINLIQNENYTYFLGEYLSRASHTLEIIETDPALHENEVLQLIQDDHIFIRVKGLKVLMIEENCFINGEYFALSKHAGELLAEHENVDKERLQNALNEPDFIAQFTTLINLGYWYINA